MDSESTKIAELLKLGQRARGEARAKIRTRLGLELHVPEDTKVSDSHVNQVEKGTKGRRTLEQVFPKLNLLEVDIGCEDLLVKVKFVEQAEALNRPGFGGDFGPFRGSHSSMPGRQHPSASFSYLVEFGSARGVCAGPFGPVQVSTGEVWSNHQRPQRYSLQRL